MAKHIPFPGDSQDQTIIGSKSTLHMKTVQANPYLILLYPKEWHTRLRLTQKPIRIGRNPESDLIIPDDQVSRNHCEVSWDGKKVIVKDLQSTNGTFVDGSRIQESQFLANNRLQIGPAVLKVDFKDSGEVQLDHELFEAATTDPLTKLGNRRWFLERAESELASAKRNQRHLHLIMLDIDHFKKVNDTLGHPAGDFVLKEASEVLRRDLRSEDLLARFGGEEFILLLRELDPKKALLFCERLRSNIESYRFVFEGKIIPITFSMGLCSEVASAESSLEKMIQKADQALYQSKHEGRNRVTAV